MENKRTLNQVPEGVTNDQNLEERARHKLRKYMVYKLDPNLCPLQQEAHPVIKSLNSVPITAKANKESIVVKKPEYPRDSQEGRNTIHDINENSHIKHSLES